jgi:hypothetical protein
MARLLLIALFAACIVFVWLDAHGISPSFLLRRWHLIWRVHKNLGLPWRAARRIVVGDGVPPRSLRSLPPEGAAASAGRPGGGRR